MNSTIITYFLDASIAHKDNNDNISSKKIQRKKIGFKKDDETLIYPLRPVAYNKGKYIAAKFRTEKTNLSNVSSQVFGQHTVYFVHDTPLRVMYNL